LLLCARTCASYPHVEERLRGDVRTILNFARVAQPVHVPGLLEIEKQFPTEFDYQLEAYHLGLIHDNLVRAGIAVDANPSHNNTLSHSPIHTKCRIPRPYPEYCTKRVLVMDELPGEKLSVALKRDVQLHAARAGKTVKQYMADIKSVEEEFESRGKVYQGPSAQEYDLYIAMHDGKRKMHNLWSRMYDLFSLIVGSPRHSIEGPENLPLNHARLIDDLLYIHGHCVLVDGCFNGDPHPGNILLSRNRFGTPELGLIDYGQVKKLSKDERHLLSRMILALADDDKEEIIRLMKLAGFRSKNMDPDVMYRYAKVSYDEDNKELTGGVHIQMFIESLQAQDPIIHLPDQFITVARSSLMLRGLAHSLHQSRSMAQLWKPIAEKVLRGDL
jgi:aarF domain-containing kinase